jgi:hypothetical protein
MERMIYIGMFGLLILSLSTLVTCGRTAAGEGNAVPYGINTRPMPTGTDLDTLLPINVGTFQRDAFAAGTSLPSDSDLNATYRSGDDEITIGFSIVDDAADAHDAIKTTRDEAKASGIDLSDEAFSVRSETSYFKTPAFISWSRGSYFFYADASDQAALDSFMQHFPY